MADRQREATRRFAWSLIIGGAIFAAIGCWTQLHHAIVYDPIKPAYTTAAQFYIFSVLSASLGGWGLIRTRSK